MTWRNCDGTDAKRYGGLLRAGTFAGLRIPGGGHQMTPRAVDAPLPQIGRLDAHALAHRPHLWKPAAGRVGCHCPAGADPRRSAGHCPGRLRCEALLEGGAAARQPPRARFIELRTAAHVKFSGRNRLARRGQARVGPQPLRCPRPRRARPPYCAAERLVGRWGRAGARAGKGHIICTEGSMGSEGLVDFAPGYYY